MRQHHGFATAGDAVRFVTAGDAIFTVVSGKTGDRLTYRIGTPKDAALGPGYDGPWFVRVLTGPSNTGDYTMLGTVWRNNGRFAYRPSRKTTVHPTAKSQVVARFLFERVFNDRPDRQIPASLTILHEGRCGRCGRLLTVPGSIEIGLGPTCQSSG